MNRSFTDSQTGELVWLKPEAVIAVWKQRDRTARVLMNDGTRIELEETIADVIGWMKEHQP